MYASGQATDDDPDFCGKENMEDRDGDSDREQDRLLL